MRGTCSAPGRRLCLVGSTRAGAGRPAPRPRCPSSSQASVPGTSVRARYQRPRWPTHPDGVLPPAGPQASPEKKKDGLRGLRPVVAGGPVFQVWPEGLQQSWVQLLGLIKNEQRLGAALLRPPHLVCQPLLHRHREWPGSPGGTGPPSSQEDPGKANASPDVSSRLPALGSTQDDQIQTKSSPLCCGWGTGRHL